MAVRRNQMAESGSLALLIFIGILALGWFVVWPVYTEIKQDRVTLSDRQARYDEKSKSIIEITKLVSKYQANADTLRKFSQAMPNAPEIPQLLSDLNRIGEQSGIQVEGVRVIDTSQAGGAAASVEKRTASTGGAQVFSQPELIKLRLEVTLKGQYQGFPLFLDLLDHNARLIDVQQLGTQTGKDTDGNDTKFSLVLSSYYQK